jgi:hypothetical protein
MHRSARYFIAEAVDVVRHIAGVVLDAERAVHRLRSRVLKKTTPKNRRRFVPGSAHAGRACR